MKFTAAAAFALALGTAPALAQEKVTYNMAWLPQGSSIGVIVAQDKGYFREVGLDTNIVRGYGGNRTANELDQGQFEFGYVDPISLILNRSNGGKIKMVGAINTRWPAGVCYVTNSFALILSPALVNRLFPGILVPSFIGELSLCLWLLVRGVNMKRWEERAS